MPDLLSSPPSFFALSATSASSCLSARVAAQPTMITEILCTYTMRNFRDHGLPARGRVSGEAASGARGAKWGAAEARCRRGLIPPLRPTRDDLPFCRLTRAGIKDG